MTKTNGKNSGVQTILDLSALPSRDFMVNIELSSEDTPTIIQIPCRAMTFKRYQEIGRMVEDPDPPYVAGKQGKIYDFQDRAYLRAKEVAGEKRQYLRLAEFVQATIPGADLQEKADWMAEHMEAGILLALRRAMDGSMIGGVAHIEARAESFRPD